MHLIAAQNAVHLAGLPTGSCNSCKEEEPKLIMPHVSAMHTEGSGATHPGATVEAAERLSIHIAGSPDAGSPQVSREGLLLMRGWGACPAKASAADGWAAAWAAGLLRRVDCSEGKLASSPGVASPPAAPAHAPASQKSHNGCWDFI